MKTVALLLCCAVLVGCTTYTKPGTTYWQRVQHSQRCQAFASGANTVDPAVEQTMGALEPIDTTAADASAGGLVGGLVAGTVSALRGHFRLHDACMREAGFR